MQYTAAMLAELVLVPVGAVRAWQRRGWLIPEKIEHRLAYFPFTELNVARNLAELAKAGIPTAYLARQLTEIQKRWPQVQRPLAELSLVVEGSRLLVRQEAGLVEPRGQFRIDFASLEESSTADEPAILVSPAALLAKSDQAAPQPQQLAQWGAELEETGELLAAAEMYRAALAAGGPRAEICFQLAEVLYRLQDYPAARERYYMAIEVDECFVEARANLGCLLAEMGDDPLALAAFEGAIRYHEDYADAHFHLAKTLEHLGDSTAARHH